MENLGTGFQSIASMATLVSVKSMQVMPMPNISSQKFRMANNSWQSVVAHPSTTVVKGTVEAGFDLSQGRSNGRSTRRGFLQTAGFCSCRSAGVARAAASITFVSTSDIHLTLCRQDWDEYRLLAEIRRQLPGDTWPGTGRRNPFGESRTGGPTCNGQLPACRDQAASNIHASFFESEPNNGEFPESCLREPPPGWTFDEESDTWKRE